MILITGSTGFLGLHLKNKLSLLNKKFIELNSDDGGITNKKSFDKLRELPISHVFHLAGKTFVPTSWDNPSKFVEINVLGTQNVLDFCKENKASMTFISAYVYGNPHKTPVSEDFPVQANTPYSLSKILAEQLCQFYRKEFNVKINIIRPFNVYGLGQKKHFLIPTIIEQALHHDLVKLKDLTPHRDYIYVTDLVDSLLRSMDLPENNSTYNIGSGHSLSVKKVAEIILKKMHIKKPIQSEREARHNEINYVIADISKAQQELKWFPQYSFEKGIEEIASSYNPITKMGYE